MSLYDDTPNPDVLQRELVEATQAVAHADAAFQRASNEHRNAEANLAAAREKVDGLQAAYDAALATRRSQQEAAKPAAEQSQAARPKAPAKGI